jgi:hypothetical protein
MVVDVSMPRFLEFVASTLLIELNDNSMTNVECAHDCVDKSHGHYHYDGESMQVNEVFSGQRQLRRSRFLQFNQSKQIVPLVPLSHSPTRCFQRMQGMR